MKNIFVCPMPIKWNEIYRKLVDECRRRLPQFEDLKPPTPLILNGWVYSNDKEKQDRWNATVKWADDHGLSHLIPELSESDIYSVDEITTYTVGPMGGPMYLAWNSEPRTSPGRLDVENALKILTSNWAEIIGKDYSNFSMPQRFTGARKRRLVVSVKVNTKAPWGEWAFLQNDESRRVFREFRRKVNGAIKPLEVDHVDFEIVQSV